MHERQIPVSAPGSRKLRTSAPISSPVRCDSVAIRQRSLSCRPRRARRRSACSRRRPRAASRREATRRRRLPTDPHRIHDTHPTHWGGCGFHPPPVFDGSGDRHTRLRRRCVDSRRSPRCGTESRWPCAPSTGLRGLRWAQTVHLFVRWFRSPPISGTSGTRRPWLASNAAQTAAPTCARCARGLSTARRRPAGGHRATERGLSARSA